MATPRKVYVVGVGMTKFEKPGRREEFDYPDMAKEAGSKALKDAGISYTEVDQAVVGYCYGDSTCGQRALYQLGMTGIPIYNVNNACATGSSALFLAKQLIEGGSSECVLALGFEKMERGSLGTKYTDRITPMDKHVEALANTNGLASSPITAQMFAAAGVEHMKKYGTRPEHFAKIAEKNHRHSVNNPYSQFRDEYTLKEIQSSRMVHEPLTKLQCCPTSDGSGAAVLCSEDFVRKHNLQSQAVEIIAMAMRTDFPSTFGENSPMKLVGYDMTKAAAEEIYRKTGYRPDDIHVVELHDCFSSNEMITYEALGLCPPGKAGEMIDRGDNTYGGKYVINPSGGLISKGHPLGATGLAQCSELCWQLRGQADKRQVPGAKLALQHNLGLGGAVVISLYRLGFPEHAMAARRRHDISLNPTSTTTLKSAVIFEEIEKEIEQNGAAIVPKIKGSYAFKITGSDGTVQEWLVDLKSGNGSVKKGSGLKGDCNISMKDDDFMDMATGKLNGQKAFFAGKLKISGNTSMAMKLQSIMPKPSTSTGTKTSTTKSTGGPILKSALIFDEIEKEIAKNGATIVPKIKGSYAFKITGSDGTVQEWLVDLKSGNGSIKKGSGLKGDCNISMKDDDFMDMATGKLNGQKAFFAGKLKISGNTSMAMKLQSIMPKPPKAKL